MEPELKKSPFQSIHVNDLRNVYNFNMLYEIIWFPQRGPTNQNAFYKSNYMDLNYCHKMLCMSVSVVFYGLLAVCFTFLIANVEGIISQVTVNN